MYDLYAVVVYSGSTIKSGHYFSYVRSDENTWHLMDDSEVVSMETSSYSIVYLSPFYIFIWFLFENKMSHYMIHSLFEARAPLGVGVSRCPTLVRPVSEKSDNSLL